ncbi:DUF1444 domain-containing protein [Myxococcus sp. CA033]|uniref:DUF1444 domain-containing protein n=1 Tax=unclassified Myxococcus TaxID=2648731 RepID=UPI00157A6667|nr:MULTISPECIES: DUF1444 domain-containing protein [unclassified Myxococcus]NTX33876.1 DUF1444 domain-containing protein [Myxococcus sp. CA033]
MEFFKRLLGLEKKASATSRTREVLLLEVEAVLYSLPYVLSVKRVVDEFAVGFRVNGSSTRMNLESLLLATQDMTPEERSHHVRQFFTALTMPASLPDSWADVREKVMPVVRPASFGPRASREVANALVERRPIPFLRVLLVMELPNSTSHMWHEHLARWEISEEEAFAAAFANLARVADSEDDVYESSRLLDPGFLASCAGKVSGRPVISVPTRSRFIFTGGQDEARVTQLCEQAQLEFESNPHAISPALYTLDSAGRVAPYLRRGNNELARRVRHGHALFALREYELQKESLQAWHEAEGVDTLLSDFTLNTRNTDGYPLAWTMWIKDQDMLLPEADLVSIDDDEGAPFIVSFPLARRLAPECFELVPDLWPTRYRTVAWPEPRVVEQLRAATVDLATFEAE